ncbi:MAG: NUDIX domain-containing protein [Anaerolineae bacterium]|nr:NUDIX domain-containing protein [Anaerolineae bacterium]
MDSNDAQINYTAAGGVVSDVTGELVMLLIRPSRDEVRLPKGHVEAGETLRAAALREVAEETGYDDLEIITPLGSQLVAFPMGNRSIKRTEALFLMRARSKHQIERPQADEQFFPVWVSWNEALAHLTFEAEREWVRRALQTLKRATE